MNAKLSQTRRANPLSVVINHTLAKSGAFAGPPSDKRGKLSRWQRNTIDWAQAPAGADGWAKRGIHAFWWTTVTDMGTRQPRLQRMAPAPLFLPDESRDVTTSMGTQPPVWRRVQWFVGLR